MTPEQRATLRQRCDTLIAELEATLAGSQGAAGTVELDQTRLGRLSRMDAMQGQAVARASADRAARQLARLRAARQRMDDPDYGICPDCDQPIASGRLLANPAVIRCVDCAAARE